MKSKKLIFPLIALIFICMVFFTKIPAIYNYKIIYSFEFEDINMNSFVKKIDLFLWNDLMNKFNISVNSTIINNQVEKNRSKLEKEKKGPYNLINKYTLIDKVLRQSLSSKEAYEIVSDEFTYDQWEEYILLHSKFTSQQIDGFKKKALNDFLAFEFDILAKAEMQKLVRVKICNNLGVRARLSEKLPNLNLEDKSTSDLDLYQEDASFRGECLSASNEWIRSYLDSRLFIFDSKYDGYFKYLNLD